MTQLIESIKQDYGQVLCQEGKTAWQPSMSTTLADAWSKEGFVEEVFFHLTNNEQTRYNLLQNGFNENYHRYGFPLFLAPSANELIDLIEDSTSYFRVRREEQSITGTPQILKVKLRLRHEIPDLTQLEQKYGGEVEKIADQLELYPSHFDPKTQAKHTKHKNRLVWATVLQAAGVHAVKSPYRASGYEIMLTDPKLATIILATIINDDYMEIPIP